MKAGERKRKRILEKDSLKKHQVLIDGILKRYKDDATYLVKVKIPGEAEPSVQKVEFKILQITPDCLSKINQSKQKEKITEILFVSPWQGSTVSSNKATLLRMIHMKMVIASLLHYVMFSESLVSTDHKILWESKLSSL